MNYIIVIINIIIISLLFKKAAGNLKIKSLNAISYLFYSLIIFNYIGMSIIYCGFTQHYLIKKILYSREVIVTSYWAMTLAMYLLPISISFFSRYVYKIKNISGRCLDKQNEKINDIDGKKSKVVYKICLISFLVCLFATIYVFDKIGYVSLFKFLDSSFDFASERIRVGRNFCGNVYIKNLGMLFLAPIISYISYIYMRKTKEKKWILLFIISFILCIFAKTYDFEKAPVIYFIAYFFLIEIILGNVNSIKRIVTYGLVIIVMVFTMYFTVSKYNKELISLSVGPLSRIVMSEPGALLLHFDAFPEKIPYMDGHSFPSFTKMFFGDGEYKIRSGRKVMELYNPDEVTNGTAGVMSTLYIGEAYANFGWCGIIVSTIVAGFIFSTILCIYLKSRNSVINIVLYIEMIITYMVVIQAGVVELFYNVTVIITLAYFILIKTLCDNNYLISLKNRIFNHKKSPLLDNTREKRMIFHVPNHIDLTAKSGSNIRPIEMIKAFQKNGYKVDVVMGYGKERKQAIDVIEDNILNGVKYDFLYSESSTMPTLLTEKHHLPTHPFLDFNFLSFCKSNGIRIGLFYRDIYWKYSEYKQNVSKYKRFVSIILYKYDLWQYKRLVNILYLPSLKMKNVVYNGADDLIVEELPPGISNKIIKPKKYDNNLNIMYVGGITKPNGLYDLSYLMDVTKIDKRVKVTICCRKNEWDNVKNEYITHMNDQITIIHKSGKELQDYYKNADLCSLIFPYNEYRSFAMPIKLFEYISYNIPVISTNNSAVGDYVYNKNIGFVVECDIEKIGIEIKKILNNHSILEEKQGKIKKIKKYETWTERAKKVANNLKGLG